MPEKSGVAAFANQMRILFDHRWYSLTYMGRLAKSDEALRHFLAEGCPAGRNPHPLFFTAYYLSQLPENAPKPENPLRHYIENGAALGLSPCPLFDAGWYAERYNVAASGLTPLAHYIRSGAAADLDPNEFFDAAWYRARYAGEIAGYGYALLHYLFTAEKELHDPSERFSTREYLEMNPDAVTDKINPLRHYLERGRGQFRHIRRPAIYCEGRPMSGCSGKSPGGKIQTGQVSGANDKVVVYSALTGNYSKLLPHPYVNPGYRYICFTDLPAEGQSFWELRPVPAGPDCGRGVRWTARHIKMHPHELFPEADWAVWCDANILIKDDITPLIESVRERGAPASFMRHLMRDCIYEEGELCIEMGKDAPEAIRAQLEEYRRNGYPEHAGLVTSGFFIANLRHPDMPRLFNAWWDELSRHSCRDQISLPYVCRKLGIIMHYLTEPGVGIHNHAKLIWLTHDATWNIDPPGGTRQL